MPEAGIPTNQIFEFIALLGRRRWSIVIPALFGLSVALVALCFIPKKYESKTVVEIGEVRFEEDQNFKNPQAIPYKDLQNVKARILSESSLSRTIIDKLQWGDFLAIQMNPGKRKKYLDEVRDRSSVELAKKVKDQGNDYLTISYKDEDPKRAATFVKELRLLWIDDTLNTFRELIRGELLQEQRQNEQLNSQLDLVRRQIKEWQEVHELSPTQASDRRTTADEDWVIREYNAARAELTRLQGEVKVYEEKYKKAVEREADEPRVVAVDPDKVAGNVPTAGDTLPTKPLLDQIAKLRGEIAQLETERAGMKKTHKQWSVKQRLIDERKKAVDAINGELAKAGVNVNAPGEPPPPKIVLNPQKQLLKREADQAKEEFDSKLALYETQRGRVTALEEKSAKRPEIFIRYRQLETTEDAIEKQYKDSVEKVERKKVILQKVDSVQGNPYRILEEPVPADSPSEPSIPLIIALGLIAGGGFGFAWVFVREFVRPSFRTPSDVTSTIALPILGAVNRMTTAVEIRRARWRGVLGIGTSLLFVAIIGGGAAVYLINPRLLPGQLVQTVDSIKQKFR